MGFMQPGIQAGQPLARIVTNERLLDLRSRYQAMLDEGYLTERNVAVAEDIMAAFTELIELRKGIRVEGTVA